MGSRYWLSVDVGTGSVRAAVSDDRGNLICTETEEISTWHDGEDFYEQSSEEIWNKTVSVAKKVIERSKTADSIYGVGFDATCSLVLLNDNLSPVGISPHAPDASYRNIILWRDHRAVAEAVELSQIATSAAPHLLMNIGGAISPEMELPKLKWLRSHLPHVWSRIGHAMDLCDFLTLRASGTRTFSHCAAVCKWLYDATAARWNDEWLCAAGLSELRQYFFAQAPVVAVGEALSATLSAETAAAFGISRSGVVVAAGLVDAHAGALGLLGAPSAGSGAPLSLAQVETRAALICGTSTCYMAVRREPVHLRGVWGPLLGAVIPQSYLLECGESATGALLQHIVTTHPAYSKVLQQLQSHTLGEVYSYLNERIDKIWKAKASEVPFRGLLTRELHVLPFHGGNRSPYADPLLRGTVSGLSLESSVEDLALLYYSTLQSLAHGVRLLLELFHTKGAAPSALLVTGGLAHNSIWLEELANICQVEVYLPRAKDAVLLGSAVSAAAAYEHHQRKTAKTSTPPPSAEEILSVCARMTALGDRVFPAGESVRLYHDAKHKVFLAMHEHQLQYRKLMAEWKTS